MFYRMVRHGVMLFGIRHGVMFHRVVRHSVIFCRVRRHSFLLHRRKYLVLLHDGEHLLHSRKHVLHRKMRHNIMLRNWEVRRRHKRMSKRLSKMESVNFLIN